MRGDKGAGALTMLASCAAKGEKRFILHDGPRYANGEYSYIRLKDIIIKSKAFRR